MSTPPLSLNVQIYDLVDEEVLDRLTRQLRSDIAKLEVENVTLAPGKQFPPGVIKGDPITIGALIVSLASAGVFTALIELLKSWALRREGRSVTVKAEVGDKKLELSFSPAETSEKEMARFAQEIMHTLGDKT